MGNKPRRGLRYWYGQTSRLFFALLIGFLVLNVISYLLLLARHTTGGPLSKYDMPKLQSVYPGFSESEIVDLLTSSWSIPIAYEPFTLFREKNFRTRFVNVSEHGYRSTSHKEPWPLRSDYCNVFIFGGSTAFGYGVPDNQTLAFYLQQTLAGCQSSRPHMVYNFGRGHYYSAQEAVLFQRLLTQGIVPDVAVFIDGFNDFVFVSGDPAFTQEFSDLLEEERSWTWIPYRWAISSPLGRLLSFVIGTGLNKLQSRKVQIDLKREQQEAQTVVFRYLRNMVLIEGLAKPHKVRTAFVWQPVPDYRYDLKSHLFYRGSGGPPNRVRAEGYRIMNDLGDRKGLGTNFIWCADIQEDLHEPLYCDAYHYTAKLSKRFARCIFDNLVKQGVLGEVCLRKSLKGSAEMSLP